MPECGSGTESTPPGRIRTSSPSNEKELPMELAQIRSHPTPMRVIAILVSAAKPFPERRFPAADPLHDPAATGLGLEHALGNGLLAGMGAIVTCHQAPGGVFDNRQRLLPRPPNPSRAESTRARCAASECAMHARHACPISPARVCTVPRCRLATPPCIGFCLYQVSQEITLWFGLQAGCSGGWARVTSHGTASTCSQPTVA
jgi:hypothetical protein